MGSLINFQAKEQQPVLEKIDKMERLKHLIKEVLSTPPKKDSCNCGCHSCENVGNPGVVLNESLVKKDI